ncbi:MAG: Holliday junction resolvase RuvX [Chloroflexi bacterium]|nr:Holliday junction resolvase RuvX [Chloroflexota bacterium]
MTRILGIDHGGKRLGVAITDPDGILATPHAVVASLGDQRDAAEIARIVAEEGVERIVLGLPLMLSGEEGEQAARVRRFGARLSEVHGLAVEYWDERLTTVYATRMLRLSGAKRDRRKLLVDSLAAAAMLQGYADSRRRQ